MGYGHRAAAQHKINMRGKVQHCGLIELNIIAANAINMALIALSILIFNSIRRPPIYCSVLCFVLQCSSRPFMLQKRAELTQLLQPKQLCPCSNLSKGCCAHQEEISASPAHAGKIPALHLAMAPHSTATLPILLVIYKAFLCF